MHNRNIATHEQRFGARATRATKHCVRCGNARADGVSIVNSTVPFPREAWGHDVAPAAAKRTTARKSTARKTTARKTTERKTAAKKSSARKTATKRTAAKKSTAKKSTARKTTARKS